MTYYSEVVVTEFRREARDLCVESYTDFGSKVASDDWKAPSA